MTPNLSHPRRLISQELDDGLTMLGWRPIVAAFPMLDLRLRYAENPSHVPLSKTHFDTVLPEMLSERPRGFRIPFDPPLVL
jgi:hypothetical protein